MAKFKVGDRVRVLPGHGMEDYGAVDGDTGTIEEDSECPFVQLDGERVNFQIVAFMQEHLELVAPATSAIRTVTRREIVPGFYGVFDVSEPTRDGVRVHSPVSRLNATDLRAAAKLFSELADVLDENAKEAA